MLLLHHVKSTWSVSNKHEATIQKFDDDTHNRNATNIYACCNIEGNMVPR
jgi:hypothetical protein